tara:strand:+ start:302 stop:508 length:207 start_codon:yes stop_codon:yes gene_type:complete
MKYPRTYESCGRQYVLNSDYKELWDRLEHLTEVLIETGIGEDLDESQQKESPPIPVDAGEADACTNSQ